MTKRLFILLDYRNTFYSSTREVAGSMDVPEIKRLFEDKGYEVEVERFSNIDFRSDKYVKSFILYQSAEDPDLRYKDYIEDILLGLKINGAILIPEFYKFRAHHNKVFMEILRDSSKFPLIQNIVSEKYGTLNEFEESLSKHRSPFVIKSGAGSKSVSVLLARSKKEALHISRWITKSYSTINLKRFLNGILSGKGFKPISNYRRKFIVQNFISGLSHDYKIIIYDNRFYVLKRGNRPGDFRASGSGILSFPEEVSDDLLNFAEKVFIFFNVPFISIDVAVRGNEYFLIEFQFLSFGQYAVEYSLFFFRKEVLKWIKVEETPNLERIFVDSVDMYIRNRTNHNKITMYGI